MSRVMFFTQPRFVWGMTAGCIMVLAIVGLLCPNPFYQKRIYDIGDIGTITISKKGAFLFYQVNASGKRVVPPCRCADVFYEGKRTLDFEVIQDRQLAIVLNRRSYFTTTPDIDAGETWSEHVLRKTLVVLHDFENGESFPLHRPLSGQLEQRLHVLAPKLGFVCRWVRDVELFPSSPDAVRSLLLLPDLKTVRLGAADITADTVRVLGKFQSLDTLDLGGAYLDHKAVESLRCLRSVNTLILPERVLSGYEKQELEKALPKTHIIYVYPD